MSFATSSPATCVAARATKTLSKRSPPFLMDRLAEILIMTSSGWIGANLRRKEDERLLRGIARFVDDHDDSRMLHVAIGRAPYPHARILGIDASAARTMSGVAAVLLGEELVK